jgi:Xaa-Pro aminopeptidase
MKHLFTFLLSTLFILPLFAQDVVKSLVRDSSSLKFEYDKDLLTKEFHQGRREALRKAMPDNSLAVFFANPIRNRSNDVDFEYHQDPNFYYLTGLREPNAILIILKDEQMIDSVLTNEIIFVQPRNPMFEKWVGRRLGKDGVHLLLGLNTIKFNYEFAGFKLDFSSFDKVFYVKGHEDVRDDKSDKGDLFSLIKHFHDKTAEIGEKLDHKKLSDMMAGLRQIKQPEEIALMRIAIDITCKAQIELMKALEPGMAEYETEAIIEYFFKRNGAEHPGFPSILGGGENSCILHYTSNRKLLSNKDILVIDVGAEYHGYTADVTRTLPVNGKFSEEQKKIYNIVLEAQNAGIKVCKAGNRFWDPHDEATKVIQKRLLELGIIKNVSEVRLYFMHGTSHYLGLDVHDPGLYGNLEPGNVITVEPGIYIPEGSPCDPKWWNIGVRIEDDILITSGEPEILSASAPRKIEEVENLMKEKSPISIIK